MKRIVFLLLVLLPAAHSAPAKGNQADDPLAAVRAACAEDAKKLCATVQPGGGRILACLKQNQDQVSDGCKQAVTKAMKQANGGAPSPSPAPSASPESKPNTAPAANTPSAAPPSSGTGAAPKAATPPSTKSSSPGGTATQSPTSSSGASGSYLRMKQVQIIAPVVDPKLGNGNDPVNMPVLDMLIPSTWDFKSNVHFNTESGCINDMYSVSWGAKSADGSIVFQGAPDATWQYADDPAELRNLTDPSRRQINAQGKPCAVAKPMMAEEYFRQKVLSFLPSGSTVVSVEPFPELDLTARKQLGLPPDEAGKAGDSRTEAIRVRVESQQDGKATEIWVAFVVLTRIFRQGRGAFYDCHAINFVALQAPKGQLEGNDKLFKIMISSIRPEAKWQAYSNGFIAWRYQVEAKKIAQIDAIWANFQNQVAQTLSEVTANQQRGSLNAAYGADQGIRGVQTFRDPGTGRTMELSNLYDHAWLNGNNEYVMSDDPNFNPNGAFEGDWNKLQVVRPTP